LVGLEDIREKNMVVRVRIKLNVDNNIIETIALANSGYEAETIQILIPIPLAEELGLWPPDKKYETIFDTAGGPLRVWIYPKKGLVKVLTKDYESKEVLVDIVVSPVADEVLLSDKLIGELEIALEDVSRGIWRFRWEERDRYRYSEPPKYWK